MCVVKVYQALLYLIIKGNWTDACVRDVLEFLLRGLVFPVRYMVRGGCPLSGNIFGENGSKFRHSPLLNQLLIRSLI